MKQPLHIILVEDDPAIQDAVRLVLTRAGHRVTVYANGNKLLNGDFEVPDVFVLDNQLAGVSGLDICRFLKTGPLGSHAPVIMLSASPSIGKLSVLAGADVFMEKPFAISVLRETIEKVAIEINNLNADV